MSNFITQEQYDTLTSSKELGRYANHICNVRCALGKTKQFKVKGTDLSLLMRCTQHGGMFTGGYCFVLCD